MDEVVLRWRRIMNYNSVYFLCQLLSGAGRRSKGGALVSTSSQSLMELMAPDQLWPNRGRESGGGGSSSGGGGTGCLELGRLRGAVPEKASSATLTGVAYIQFFFGAWSLNYLADGDWLEILVQHLLFLFYAVRRPSQENKCFHLGYCRHLKEQFIPNCKTFL